MIETIILVICSANLVLSVYGLFRKPKTVAGSVAIQPAVPGVTQSSVASICSKCGRKVARYEPQEDGSIVCANCPK